MFELIGLAVVLIVGWAILKVILYRVFPEYGLKHAERRYQRDPDSVNERLLWQARSRVKNKRSR